MNFKRLNGIKTYVPTSRKKLIEYAFKSKNILVAVNAEKIYHATAKSRKFINKNIGYPDGFGAVMLLKKKGVRNAVKIPGCELWLQIIESYYKTKSFYLIGGRQEVITSTVNKLKAGFTGINICNYRNGYIKTKQEELFLIDDVKKHKPDVVLVAMGSPKQEQLIEKLQENHKAVYQGLGGSFDVYTGLVKRAPKWWVKHNLEWANRLLRQPSRIKRQIHLLPFAFNMLLKY